MMLLLGCMVILTAVEWFAGKLAEKIKWKKWWDYTSKRYNFDAKASGHIERRIGKSYPSVLQESEEKKEKSRERCSFVHVFWLFVIGAFAGDMVETVFCRITAGTWMSRSSLVWGHFSVVWGLAIALVTVLLYKNRNKQKYHIFWMGVFLGGAYEYICSVFTEMVFGKVFWDYSAMPFNLGGRINLLYCFFWGIAAVVWIKVLYPKIAKVIEIILKKTGWMMTGIFVVFMVINIFVSMLALIRYDTRTEGKEAVYSWEQAMDEYFDDDRMDRIYPNGIRQ